MHFSNQNKYGGKFSEFMEKQQKSISEDEKQKRMKQAKEELDEISQKAHQESEQAQEKLKSTKQAFEEFSNKKENEEMNIKDVFKNINLKGHLDEASNIFKDVKKGASKRVSGILEMRKALFNKEKKEEVEKMVKEKLEKQSKDEMKGEATGTIDQEEEKAAPEQPDETKTDTSETSKEEKSEPKESSISKLKSKISNTTETINNKAPILYKTGVFFKNLWQETFPSDDNKMRKRIHKRREIAKMQANYTPEEIEQMQEEIPEWKRTAVTMVDEDKVQEEHAGYIKKLYRKVSTKVSDTSVAKKIMESEEYKEIKKKYREVKTEASEFKEDFKDEVETTQNPVVGTARSATGYVFQETELSKAIGKMKLYDPEFDVLDVNYEVEEIFVDLFDNYLEGDLEYLQKF